MSQHKNDRFTLNFKEISSKDLMLVGGKGSNLGELTAHAVPVPPGFVVTTNGYNLFLKESDIGKEIFALIKKTNVEKPDELNKTAETVKAIILKTPIPQVVIDEIKEAYRQLSGFSDALVAVRSSATAEDIPGASFAGQQATFLNIRGEKQLVNAVRGCWASLFEPRAIFYRATKGFEHEKVSIAVPVQKMVQSEASGVMFTVNPITNNKNQITIEAVFGLGEMIVSGSVTPDNYLVDKSNNKIVEKHISQQEKMLVRTTKTGKNSGNLEIKVSTNWQRRQKLSDNGIKELARIGRIIEKHYKYPQDIEWAYAGGKLWIVQSRPVTTMELPEVTGLSEKELKEAIPLAQKVEASLKSAEVKLPIALDGVPASPGILSGKVRIIKGVENMSDLKPGEVLVTVMTTPSWVPIMRIASAIITDQGGSTAHAAIVSRELGIPCVVGTQTATKALRTGQWVTLDGSLGKVYEGKLDEAISTKAQGRALLEQSKDPSIDANARPSDDFVPEHKKIKTATKVYVNLGEPDLAEKVAKLQVDGVGLLRAEFMLATFGVHPSSILKNKRARDKYVNDLAKGIAKFCKAFGTRPVVYRATDFKTNEYMALKGATEFEFEEANPMIGYRGVSRYVDNADVFNLELEAIRIVRNKLGYKNLWLMLPFVRTVEELVEAKRLISASGLRRAGSFKIYMMVEIPSNVILIEDFINAGIDGVSMGTNDLTQLMLGIDRDNPKVQKVFDERNPSVLWAMERVVKACAKHKIACSICGQAPSVYPEITKKLVKWGITSVSVNADMIDKTREVVSEVEKAILRRR